jgi:hypothetical protein
VIGEQVVMSRSLLEEVLHHLEQGIEPTYDLGCTAYSAPLKPSMRRCVQALLIGANEKRPAQGRAFF